MAAGNALAAYPALVERLSLQVAGLLPGIVPAATAVARLAAPRLAGRGIDVAEAVPVYVRDKVALTVAERLAKGAGVSAVPCPASRYLPMNGSDRRNDRDRVDLPYPWTRGNFADSLLAGYSAWVCRVGGELVGYVVV